MKLWRAQVALLIVSLGLCSCVGAQASTPIISEAEVSGVLEQCDVSAKETFMVDTLNWGRGTALLDMSGQLRISCDRVHLSLLSWRSSHGDDWGFLDNPASSDPLSSLDDFRALGLWMSSYEGPTARVLSVNMLAGQVGHIEGNSVSSWLDNYSQLNNIGMFIDLESNRLANLKGLVVDAMSRPGWAPIADWLDVTSIPSTGTDWVPVELAWEVVVCAADYQLYRFVGAGAAPTNFLDFVDALWEFTT